MLNDSALAINLVARGNGKLDVARQLVGKSFASWVHQKAEENVNLASPDGLNEVIQVSAEERFMSVLVETLERRRKKRDEVEVDSMLDILNNRDALKKASKSFISLAKAMEQEETTLSYLEQEIQQSEERASDYLEIEKHLSLQQERIREAKMLLRQHAFTAMAELAQMTMSLKEDSKHGHRLREALTGARGFETSPEEVPFTAMELVTYAKSAVVAGKRTRKLLNSNPGLDPTSLFLTMDDSSKDSSWESMLAITNTLLSYGCLKVEDGDPRNCEEATFSITPAGMNVGMLGFDNSLWALVAIGGSWYHPDSHGDESTSNSLDANSGMEAKLLVEGLCGMDAAEFAGYISAFVSEGSRSDGSEVLDVFRGLTPSQQRVIQTALTLLDQFMGVQERHSVEPGARTCNFDISSVDVVTQWARGCTWSEALSLSGLPPGDLVRTLSRVLDAARQLGKLPYEPIRKGDLSVGGGRESMGIHPRIRRLCVEAVAAIDRYPVKDNLLFESSGDASADESGENDSELLEVSD